MTSKQRKRRCIIEVILLFALLPGFPLWIIGGAFLIRFAGNQWLAEQFFFYLSGRYYGFARIFLGDTLIPTGMMGLDPTTAGLVVTAIFYALIALVLSWLLFRPLQGHVPPNPSLGPPTPRA